MRNPSKQIYAYDLSVSFSWNLYFTETYRQKNIESIHAYMCLPQRLCSCSTSSLTFSTLLASEFFSVFLAMWKHVSFFKATWSHLTERRHLKRHDCAFNPTNSCTMEVFAMHFSTFIKTFTASGVKWPAMICTKETSKYRISKYITGMYHQVGMI